MLRLVSAISVFFVSGRPRGLASAVLQILLSESNLTPPPPYDGIFPIYLAPLFYVSGVWVTFGQSDRRCYRDRGTFDVSCVYCHQRADYRVPADGWVLIERGKG